MDTRWWNSKQGEAAEEKLMTTLGSEAFLESAWGIKENVNSGYLPKTLTKAKKLKPGMYFADDKNSVVLPHDNQEVFGGHWYVKTPTGFTDSFSAELQPDCTNGFCQSFAAALVSKDKVVKKLKPGEYLKNHNAMCDRLMEKVNTKTIANKTKRDLLLRTLKTIRTNPRARDDWLG